MSARIERCFEAAAARGGAALIPFMTAGDPDPEQTVALMHALVAAGADLIELGVPFSDPMADGPVIQASSERAIRRGVDLAAVLGWVTTFREQDDRTPVVLMGYMNPFERFGYDRLAEAAGHAGVDGVLMVDCPPEELDDLQRSLDERDISVIRLVAPTTDAARARSIVARASGFVYYVSFKGTTGAGRLDAEALAEPLAALRELTDLPVAVGFGIADGDSARAVARHADGVVVGSALVERLAEADDPVAEAGAFVAALRAALDPERDV